MSGCTELVGEVLQIGQETLYSDKIFCLFFISQNTQKCPEWYTEDVSTLHTCKSQSVGG